MANKARNETSKQLKQLFILFTKQRKALELSIKKNKKFEYEVENHNRVVNDYQKQNLQLQLKIDELEQKRELLVNKHQREIEAISLESQEKKLLVQRLQNELKEFQDNKYSMKGRLEDYEDKIKRMIKEFEEESKRHIKEVNDIHY